MRSVTFAIIALLVVGCSPKNPLLGTWVADGERTLSELRAMDEPPETALACFEKGVCGEAEVRYLKDTYVTISKSAEGRLLGEVTAPYDLIEVNEEYVVIDQFENGGKFQVHFADELTIYIKTEQGFNDYYVRR